MGSKLLVFGLLLISLLSLGCLGGAPPNVSAPPANTTQANYSNRTNASVAGASHDTLPTILGNLGEVTTIAITRTVYSNNTNEVLVAYLYSPKSRIFAPIEVNYPDMPEQPTYRCYKMNDSAVSAMANLGSSLPAMFTITQGVPCDDAVWGKTSYDRVEGDRWAVALTILNEKYESVDFYAPPSGPASLMYYGSDKSMRCFNASTNVSEINTVLNGMEPLFESCKANATCENVEGIIICTDAPI